jgi:hypothetical protein
VIQNLLSELSLVFYEESKLNIDFFYCRKLHWFLVLLKAVIGTSRTSYTPTFKTRDTAKEIVSGNGPVKHFYSPCSEDFVPQVDFQSKKFIKNGSVAVSGASEHGQ